MSQITHKTIVASLKPEVRKALLERSDAAGIKQAAKHFCLIIICGLYIYFNLPLWQLALVAQGILLIFLFTALHETIHGTAFKTPWLNSATAHFSGFIIFLPAGWFKQFHFAHHRHTNLPELDPELSEPKPRTFIQYCKYLSGIPVWVFHVKTLFINALAKNDDSFVAKNHRNQITKESRMYLLGYILLTVVSFIGDSTILLWLWIIPIILGQPFLRAYLLAEHTLCPEVNNMLLNTRTTMTIFFIRFIAWNMPYHVEHHTLPSIPFYKLPQFHQHLKDHLNVLENGYIEFHKKMLKEVN